MERHNLTQVVIEGIANILGDTKEGLNGSEIHKCLLLSNIEDVDDKNTKRIRLYNAFAKACNYNPQNEMFRHFRTKCSISQNETYLRESFSLPINQIKKHRKNLLLRCFFIACLFGYLAKIH